MSRTYKYPQVSQGESVAKEGYEVKLRIKKRLEWLKKQSKKKIRVARSLKKFISFRDRQRERG